MKYIRLEKRHGVVKGTSEGLYRKQLYDFDDSGRVKMGNELVVVEVALSLSITCQFVSSPYQAQKDSITEWSASHNYESLTLGRVSRKEDMR